jgi:FeS assembly protein IscX
MAEFRKADRCGPFRVLGDGSTFLGRCFFHCADVDPLTIDWETLHRWVVDLSDFADDVTLAHMGWMRDIQQEWYEEVSNR